MACQELDEMADYYMEQINALCKALEDIAISTDSTEIRTLACDVLDKVGH